MGGGDFSPCTNIFSDRPLLSIIVPVYNTEKFLEKCIKSIIEQTYNNIELILIDDGSTDQSGKICEIYQQQDERIKLLQIENQGQANARNTGIANSNGEYITFIDSDDYIGTHTTIEDNMQILINNNEIEILQYPTYLVNKHTKKKLYTPCEQFIQGNEAITKCWFTGTDEINYCIWNKIYKSSMIIDLTFPKKVIFEDIFFCSNLIKRTNNVYISSQGSYCHYENTQSITRTEENAQQLKIDSIYAKTYLLNNLPDYSSIETKKIDYFLKILRNYLEIYSIKNKKLQASKTIIYSNVPKFRHCIDYMRIYKNKYSMQLVLMKILGLHIYSLLYITILRSKKCVKS